MNSIIKKYVDAFDLPKYLKDFDIKDQFTKIEILSQDDQYYLSADIDDLCNLTFRLTEDLINSHEMETDIRRASLIYHAFKTLQSKIDVKFSKCTYPSIGSDATFVIFDRNSYMREEVFDYLLQFEGDRFCQYTSIHKFDADYIRRKEQITEVLEDLLEEKFS